LVNLITLPRLGATAMVPRDRLGTAVVAFLPPHRVAPLRRRAPCSGSTWRRSDARIGRDARRSVHGGQARDFVPTDHPLRPIRLLVNEALGRLSGLFNLIYADSGRASIAPEKLLRAMLIQVFFSVRSERQLMEQVRYNLLYRWFIGLAIDDEVWDHSSFSKKRDRLLEHAVVESFFTEGDDAGRQARAAEQGALLGRRHLDPGLGQPQELRAQGRSQR
jgi:transposase